LNPDGRNFRAIFQTKNHRFEQIQIFSLLYYKNCEILFSDNNDGWGQTQCKVFIKCKCFLGGAALVLITALDTQVSFLHPVFGPHALS